MFEKINYLTAFLIGLLSSGHCVAMCGGIVSMFSINFDNYKNKFLYSIIYNISRILSYAVIALITNIFGSIFFDLGSNYIFFLSLFQISF